MELGNKSLHSGEEKSQGNNGKTSSGETSKNDKDIDLERIRAIRDLRQTSNAFARLLGIESLDINLGYAKRRIVVDERHINPLGGVHGGCLYSLADNTGGDAAASYGNWITTLDGSLNFLAPAINLKEIICEARAIKHGKNVTVVRVEIFSDAGKLLCDGSFTYFDLRKPIEGFFTEG